jgi:septal ring factor EnvC (AmiA/AmiB activator)
MLFACSKGVQTMTTMKLALSPYEILEYTTLGVALAAVALSGVTFWHLKTHLRVSQAEFDAIYAQIGNTDRSALVHQEAFQETQVQVDALSRDLSATRAELNKLQADFGENQTTLQNLQDQMSAYKTQINALETENQTLVTCIEKIEPVARKISLIPASISNVHALANFLTTGDAVGRDVLQGAQEFDSVWTSGAGACYQARVVAFGR